MVELEEDGRKPFATRDSAQGTDVGEISRPSHSSIFQSQSNITGSQLLGEAASPLCVTEQSWGKEWNISRLG